MMSTMPSSLSPGTLGLTGESFSALRSGSLLNSLFLLRGFYFLGGDQCGISAEAGWHSLRERQALILQMVSSKLGRLLHSLHGSDNKFHNTALVRFVLRTTGRGGHRL